MHGASIRGNTTIEARLPPVVMNCSAKGVRQYHLPRFASNISVFMESPPLEPPWMTQHRPSEELAPPVSKCEMTRVSVRNKAHCRHQKNESREWNAHNRQPIVTNIPAVVDGVAACLLKVDLEGVIDSGHVVMAGLVGLLVQPWWQLHGLWVDELLFRCFW